MGTEHELYKPNSQERFDLGKGVWSCIFNPINPNNAPEQTQFKIYDLFDNKFELYHCLLLYIAPAFDKQTTLGYFAKLAEIIYLWCGTDTIQFWTQEEFNDKYWNTQDDYATHHKKYPYTGTRYIKDWVKIITEKT